ncbi:MAG: PLP-dependent aminotransferase family protein [Caldilineaceae bacterium]|nr:PLP-dependent aminotransferase family protein [Caldilineaceae bacterium]
MNLERHFSDRAQRMQPLAIRDALRSASRPDIIPFIAGQPAPDLFPAKAIGYQASQILETKSAAALQYGDSQGYAPLRQWVANRYPQTSPEQILTISGSQQALDLTAKLFVNPNDKVIVAAPTYAGALSTYQIYGAEYLPVPCDGEGMLPGPLEAAMQQNPRLVYAIPNFMNPTGVCMSLARRQHLAALAQQYDVVIVEDDPYGELRFEGERLPNLFELAPNHVLYAGSFSKILAPGLRMGWMIAPAWAKEKLMIAKQTADLQSPTYLQYVLAELLEDDFIEQQFARLRDYYRKRRDLMMAALTREFPSEAAFACPTGGMFIWCELPAHVNATELLPQAIERKVAYMPGAAFFSDGSGHHTLRLSYTLADEAQINQGIKILGELFKEAIIRPYTLL